MCEVEMTDGPLRRERVNRMRIDASAKKSDLKAETAAIGRLQMPRVIPPFGPKFVVGAVVARKLIQVSRRCHAETLIAGLAGRSGSIEDDSRTPEQDACETDPQARTYGVGKRSCHHVIETGGDTSVFIAREKGTRKRQ